MLQYIIASAVLMCSPSNNEFKSLQCTGWMVQCILKNVPVWPATKDQVDFALENCSENIPEPLMPE